MPVSLQRLFSFLLAIWALSMPLPVLADHPGHKLDEAMKKRERYFQPLDKPAPPFALRDAAGKPVALADFNGKVVVLYFIYSSCTDVCPLHSEKIAEVQAKVNQTPMKDLVRFVAVTTDPAQDTPEVLAGYGPMHGLDAANWTFLTFAAGEPEDATRKLAQAYGHKFTPTGSGQQTHGVVTHVIDRTGRWRANFHGLKFSAVNLLQYINGLTNEAVQPR